MALNVYGIPTCNSCKKARKWLTDNGIEHNWINTRQNPPSKDQVTSWIADIGNRVMRNTSGGSYRALGEEKKSWTDAQWADAFAADAMLLKRPLFERSGTALMTGFRGSDESLREKLGL